MNNPMLEKWLIPAIAAALLSACGGGGGGDDDDGEEDIYEGVSNTEQSRTGYFLDSAVENLRYSTNTHDGVTDAEGSYQYTDFERIEFSIGSIHFPEVDVQEYITPNVYVDTGDALQNMVVLLQSLDIDGDPTNGITISDQAHEAAAHLANDDITSASFIIDNAELFTLSGSVHTLPVPVDQAMDHLSDTLWNQLRHPEVAPTSINLVGRWLVGTVRPDCGEAGAFDYGNEATITNVGDVYSINYEYITEFDGCDVVDASTPDGFGDFPGRFHMTASEIAVALGEDVIEATIDGASVFSVLMEVEENGGSVRQVQVWIKY